MIPFHLTSIIIQKNMLCANKISVIYFCPNCVNFLPENVHFLFYFIYLFIYLYYYYYYYFLVGGDCPLPLPQLVHLCLRTIQSCRIPVAFAPQKTLFDLLGMVYDKVGNGINFHMRILVL